MDENSPERKKSFFENIKNFLSTPIGGKKPEPNKGNSGETSENSKEDVMKLLGQDGKQGTGKATKVMLKDNFEELQKSLSSDPLPYLRKYAAVSLGDLGDKRAIECLHRALCDESLEVKVSAARSLVKLGDETFVDKLIDTLKDSNEYLIEQTNQVLSAVGEPAVEPLIKALSSKNWLLPYNAVKSLGRIGNPKAIKALVKVIEDDSNVYVQKAAVDAIEKMGQKAEDGLIEALENEAPWYVKEKVSSILGKIGSEASIPKLKTAIEQEEDIKIKERLEEALNKIFTRYNINQ